MRSLASSPSSEQRTAILRLLDDDDASTIALMQMQLTETRSLEQLRALRAEANGRAAHHLDEIITEIARTETDAAFSQLCENFGENGDLEEASWLLASAFLPGEDFERARAILDHWGEEVARRLVTALTKAERVRVLSEFLGRDMRLRGNDGDYYALD
ncbi:MAG: hypothetical protein EOP84_21200, partial [Verrucomicrobiaceae bacterium]